jgi:hypothetical protein
MNEKRPTYLPSVDARQKARVFIGCKTSLKEIEARLLYAKKKKEAEMHFKPLLGIAILLTAGAAHARSLTNVSTLLSPYTTLANDPTAHHPKGSRTQA